MQLRTEVGGLLASAGGDPPQNGSGALFWLFVLLIAVLAVAGAFWSRRNADAADDE